MPRFFVEPEQVGGNKIIIEGKDVNHITKVLRMKIGDELIVSDGTGFDYYCAIDRIEGDAVFCELRNKWESYSELPVRLTLFQGLPKADKMELIIQKTVELGVYEIVPVAMQRSIAKLDDKKAGRKVERWQSISESAAKQAGRGIIPKVTEPMSFAKALEYAKGMDGILVPYENAKGISYTKDVIKEAKEVLLAKEANAATETNATTGSKAAKKTNAAPEPNSYARLAIFIGPEGGFADSEIEKAKEAGAKLVTLGKRILRTETAGMATLAILMYEFEA